ncbi:glycosyl transferase [Niabella ginsenosidivorans]|uniref:Glycosyl transferase n=1 Tax=Niabella ginsenosidivorans TaxID=1176587 RepID=A0A1A9I669_9BACT|nr:glycosyltransferase family 4 protein [Niabella ginsenosidivorans]ANH82549.1 glycosyl transferase [Niabella ginsenosidivorans]
MSYKIAVLSPVAWRTPPRHYGPWEQVASNIAEGLVEKGWDVTLFATQDSFTKGRLEAVIPAGYEEDNEADAKVAECLHISYLMEQADTFDLIHNHFDFLPLTYTGFIKTPVITTIHGFSSFRIIPVYKKYNTGNNYYVSISNADRHPELTYTATVYNGIDSHDFSFNETPENYLLYFGRIHPDKGTFEAIQIAKKAGWQLLISGIIQDERYFDEKVAPWINQDDILYMGVAGPHQRNQLLGHAAALLHPIRFHEPFGLSVAEAQFCGTPVIAFNKGSMPELIVPAKTGFLVSNIEEAALAVADLPRIHRRHCREWAVKNFSKEKMVDDYIAVYKTILENP